MKYRLVLLTAIGLLALAALPALAAAGQTYKTTTTIQVKPTKAEGKLISANAACLKNREIDVRLFVIGGTPGQPVAIKSDGSGRWSVKLEVSSEVRGQVEVRVAEKRLGGGKTCGATEEREPF